MGLTLLVAVVGVATLLIVQATTQHRARVPAGCAPADRDQPGCRPEVAKGPNSTTVALVALILAPAGALGAALLTAGAARRSQEVEHGEQTRRLKAQLDAEAERQAAAFAHERQVLLNRDIKDEMDSALGTASDVQLAAISLSSVILSYLPSVAEVPEAADSPFWLETRQEHQNALHEANLRFARNLNKLIVLLGRNSPVCGKCRDLWNAGTEVQDHAKKSPWPPTEESTGAMRAVLDAFGDASNAFLDAAHQQRG